VFGAEMDLLDVRVGVLGGSSVVDIVSDRYCVLFALVYRGG
jgi:hypothetical protein